MLQSGVPPFETLVVDDGSLKPPTDIRERFAKLGVKMVRQSHSGVSVARNHGIELASGEVLLFLDADCTARQGCLASLMQIIPTYPEDSTFQLHIVGDRSYPVGRAEDLHLATIQRYRVDAEGRILGLDAAGFVIRNQKSWIPNLFDARAVRSEDTELLARLLADGKPRPRFLSDAVVEHHPDLSVPKYLVKAFRCGYIDGPTRMIMETYGVELDPTMSERLDMLKLAWKLSRQSSLGYQAFFVTAVARLLKKAGHIAYKIARFRLNFSQRLARL